MATKLKIAVSLDAGLVKFLKKTQRDSKGGVSGWINDACKRKIRREEEAKRRQQQIAAERQQPATVVEQEAVA